MQRTSLKVTKLLHKEDKLHSGIEQENIGDPIFWHYFQNFSKLLTYVVPKFAASLRFTRIITSVCYNFSSMLNTFIFLACLYPRKELEKLMTEQNWVKNHSPIGEVSKSTKCLTYTPGYQILLQLHIPEKKWILWLCLEDQQLSHDKMMKYGIKCNKCLLKPPKKIIFFHYYKKMIL